MHGAILHIPQKQVNKMFAFTSNDIGEAICEFAPMQNRIRDIRKARGWPLRRLADELSRIRGEDVDISTVQRLELGEIQLTQIWMEQIAKSLDCSLYDLLPGGPPRARTVPLVGYVGAGDLYYPDPASGPWVGFDVVDAPPGEDNVVAVRVKGNSMAPVYRDGDLLFFQKDKAVPLDECIGEDCIVQVRNGPSYLKIVARGSRQGRYILKSYNSETPDIANADIEWASPIDWHRRRRKRLKEGP